jgi:hypothetical protein
MRFVRNVSYYVSFQFSDDINNYSLERRVSKDIYDTAEKGVNIPIVYVPLHPEWTKIVGNESPPSLLSVLGSLIWIGIILLVIVFAIRAYWRDRFLARNGIRVEGVILASSYSTDSEGGLTLRLEYAFEMPDSHKFLTKTECATRNDLQGKPLPPPGTPVLILYYNERQYMLL